MKRQLLTGCEATGLYFYGRPGGGVPTPEELVRFILSNIGKRNGSNL